MILYKFETKSRAFGKGYEVTEVEVEEKQKVYIAKGFVKTRINKNDIGKLSAHYGNSMYLLENNPKQYINAKIESAKGVVETLEKRLENSKENLARWEELLKIETECGEGGK